MSKPKIQETIVTQTMRVYDRTDKYWFTSVCNCVNVKAPERHRIRFINANKQSFYLEGDCENGGCENA